MPPMVFQMGIVTAPLLLPYAGGAFRARSEVFQVKTTAHNGTSGQKSEPKNLC
jgi:hypothetical protein